MSDPNPYQPPEPLVGEDGFPENGLAEPSPGDIAKPGASLGKTILVWTLVCVLAAGPSFYWGVATVARDNILAMLLGITAYIFVYVWADFRTRRAAWRNGRLVPIAMKITYWLRGIMSVIFPVGIFLDAWFGMVSVFAWQSIFRTIAPNYGSDTEPFPSLGFVGTLVVTLTQGAMLHLLLIAIFLLMWLIVFMANDFRSRRSPPN